MTGVDRRAGQRSSARSGRIESVARCKPSGDSARVCGTGSRAPGVAFARCGKVRKRRCGRINGSAKSAELGVLIGWFSKLPLTYGLPCMLASLLIFLDEYACSPKSNLRHALVRGLSLVQRPLWRQSRACSLVGATDLSRFPCPIWFHPSYSGGSCIRAVSLTSPRVWLRSMHWVRLS